MHFWKSRHTITTVNMTITPLWQEKFMFCLIKTVLISQSPVTSTLVIWNLNICVQIVLVTWSSYVLICLWWCLFPPGTPQGEFWLAVGAGLESWWFFHRPWCGVCSHYLTCVEWEAEGGTWGTFREQMDIRPAGAIVALLFEHGFGVWRVWAALWPLSVTVNGAGSVVT